MGMLGRFALYGFLKNQRYFEPYLVLLLLDRGLSFTTIGALVATRELTVNLLEIPSGGFADGYGRRRALALSFAAYILGFLGLGLLRERGSLFAAIVLLAVGDAFRSGTHKALIFTWLRNEGRSDERTRVYGFTRSWSKVGSALAVPIGALIVWVSGGFEWTLLATVPPYLLALWNLRAYPAAIDTTRRGASLGEVSSRTWRAVRALWRNRSLRGLVGESTAFEGTFGAARDYVQPVILVLVTGGVHTAFDGVSGDEATRVAAITVPVFLALSLLSALASRLAYRWVALAGDSGRAAVTLWVSGGALYAAIALADLAGAEVALVGAFVLLHVVQNVWRPTYLGRLDRVGPERDASTTLSVDGQARRLVDRRVRAVAGSLDRCASLGGKRSRVLAGRRDGGYRLGSRRRVDGDRAAAIGEDVTGHRLLLEVQLREARFMSACSAFGACLRRGETVGSLAGLDFGADLARRRLRVPVV